MPASSMPRSSGDSDFHTHVHLVPRIAGQRVALPRDAEWVNLSVGDVERGEAIE